MYDIFHEFENNPIMYKKMKELCKFAGSPEKRSYYKGASCGGILVKKDSKEEVEAIEKAESFGLVGTVYYEGEKYIQVYLTEFGFYVIKAYECWKHMHE